jgi:hypothetical protein
LIIGVAAVAIGVAVAGLIVSFAPRSIGPPASALPNVTEATVTATALCSGPDPRDEVSYQGDTKAKVSSCGKPVGTKLQIAIPDHPTDTLQIAATGVSNAEGYRPTALVLLVLSGLAGVTFVYLIARGKFAVPAIS